MKAVFVFVLFNLSINSPLLETRGRCFVFQNVGHGIKERVHIFPIFSPFPSFFLPSYSSTILFPPGSLRDQHSQSLCHRAPIHHKYKLISGYVLVQMGLRTRRTRLPRKSLAYAPGLWLRSGILMRHEEGTRAGKMTNESHHDEFHDDVRSCLGWGNFPTASFLPLLSSFEYESAKLKVPSIFSRIHESIHPHFIIRRKRVVSKRMGNSYESRIFKSVSLESVELIAIIAMVEVASGHFLKIAINPCPRKVLRTLRSLINLNEWRAINNADSKSSEKILIR